MSATSLSTQIANYWNEHIHDLALTTQPVGSAQFFAELDAYRYEKLDYLPRLVNFEAYRGKKLLEVGCGAGIDLVRFARAGAQVSGIDLSQTAIDLARKNLQSSRLEGELAVMDGEAMQFPDQSFDVVFAHGVLQYTGDPGKMIQQIHRVLRPGGEAILMVYNKVSWLNLMRVLFGVALEHEDAPVLRKFTAGEFKQLLEPFSAWRIIVERFPVKSRLHGGLKGQIYNTFFVGAFKRLPKRLVRPFGWHLMAFAQK